MTHHLSNQQPDGETMSLLDCEPGDIMLHVSGTAPRASARRCWLLKDRNSRISARSLLAWYVKQAVLNGRFFLFIRRSHLAPVTGTRMAPRRAQGGRRRVMVNLDPNLFTLIQSEAARRKLSLSIVISEKVLTSINAQRGGVAAS